MIVCALPTERRSHNQHSPSELPQSIKSWLAFLDNHFTARRLSLEMIHSNARIAASEKGAPAVFGGFVSLLLINQFAMSRTKASVHPPAAIPKTTGADT
jgi:hypothetical protein